MMSKPPPWKDLKKVEQFVIDEIEYPDLTEWPVPPTTLPEPFEIENPDDVDEDQLVELVRPIPTMRNGRVVYVVNPHVPKLSIKTWSRTAWRLNRDATYDELFPEPKKPKGRGRPKMTSAQREATYPIYAAAEEARLIVDKLKMFYPTEKKIRERACEIASHRHEVDAETILLHLSRPHRHRA